jgi:hypothetical protein
MEIGLFIVVELFILKQRNTALSIIGRLISRSFHHLELDIDCTVPMFVESFFDKVGGNAIFVFGAAYNIRSVLEQFAQFERSVSENEYI